MQSWWGATGSVRCKRQMRHCTIPFHRSVCLSFFSARAHKAEGNNLMAKKEPKAALTEYKKAIEALEAIKSVDMGSWMAHIDEVQQLNMSVWSNSALAALKADLLAEVLTYADLLLAHDDKHPKVTAAQQRDELVHSWTHVCVCECVCRRCCVARAPVGCLATSKAPWPTCAS